MQITTEQGQALDVLVPLGFAITNFYGDGVIRVARVGEPDSGVFIRQDGSLKKQVVPTFDSDGNIVDNG